MCCSAVEHLVRRLYCQKCYRCLRTNSIEPIINEINFLIFILLFFGLLDTPQNISPDVLLLNSPWDALQDTLLDALLDSLPETLPYTSPFQTNFEQWYVLPNLAKLLLFFLSLWAVRSTHRSFWCLLNGIIITSNRKKYNFWNFSNRSFWCLLNGIIITSSRKKIQFLKFFLPLILMIVLGKLEKVYLNPQPLILMVPIM